MKFYLLDFNESPSFFECDVSSFAFTSDEAVGFLEMLAESVVGVDDGDVAGVP